MCSAGIDFLLFNFFVKHRKKFRCFCVYVLNFCNGGESPRSGCPCTTTAHCSNFCAKETATAMLYGMNYGALNLYQAGD